MDSNNALFLNDKNKFYKDQLNQSPFSYRSYNSEGYLISTGSDNPLSQSNGSFPYHHNRYNVYTILAGNTIADTLKYKEGGSQYVFTSIRRYEFDETKFNMIGAQNFGKFFEGKMNRHLISAEYEYGTKIYDYLYDFDGQFRVVRLTKKRVDTLGLSGTFDYTYY